MVFYSGGVENIKQMLSDAVLEQWCVCVCCIISCKLWGFVPIKRKGGKKKKASYVERMLEIVEKLNNYSLFAPGQ